MNLLQEITHHFLSHPRTQLIESYKPRMRRFGNILLFPLSKLNPDVNRDILHEVSHIIFATPQEVEALCFDRECWTATEIEAHVSAISKRIQTLFGEVQPDEEFVAHLVSMGEFDKETCEKYFDRADEKYKELPLKYFTDEFKSKIN